VTGQLITDWSVEICVGLAYVAPERRDHFHLAGDIDGKRKLTSRVVKTVGRLVYTRSGSIYRLGRIAKHYRAWLVEHGLTYDRKQPVKVHVARGKGR